MLFAAGILLVLFALTVFIQIISPKLPQTSFIPLAIHVRNGFYANAVFDKIVGALKTKVRYREKKIAEFSREPYDTLTINSLKQEISS